MGYCFDDRIDRRGTGCAKWDLFEDDVLPMWVADMDFRSPEPVIRALAERVAEGVFGYPCEPEELRQVFIERLEHRFAWRVQPEAVVILSGVVIGFNLACHTAARRTAPPGGAVLIQPPVYMPFLQVATNAGMALQMNQLVCQADGTYAIDFDAFEKAITPETRLFLLCNPHNPVGRVLHADELTRLAEICLRHGVTICSDEIHGDLVFSGHSHIPIAALDPEVAKNTITLMAPSKTFNIAGLECSLAVIPDADLRRQFLDARQGLAHTSANIMGYTAALAAYREGQPWLNELLEYLEGNRNYLVNTLAAELPEIKMAAPEGTYLAWLDCRQASIEGSPADFFLKKARVAFNDGASFGPGGEGHVRLNFGCPRSMLVEALERMKASLQK
jgi:Bifunctional PLP-dependent enzyme with beta-cystathionase and maltose regulon repressor activities